MSRWTTLQATCALLRPTPNDLSEGAALDWEALVAFASAQLVTPAMARAVSRFPGAPADVVDYFGAVHAANARRNADLVHQATTLAADLDRAGLQAVFLKGTASLFAGLYADPAERVVGDIDLLVAPGDVAAAVDVARKAGYQTPSSRDHLWFATPSHHAPILVNEHGIGLEIHRALGPRRCARILPASTVLASAITVETGGVSVWIPSLADRLAHNIVHARLQTRDFDRERMALRQLREFAWLARSADTRPVDWMAIEDRFVRSKTHAALRHHASLSMGLFGVAVPFRDLDPDGEIARLRAAMGEGGSTALHSMRRFVATLMTSAGVVADNPHLAANLFHPLWWSDRLRRLRGQP